MTKNPAHKVLYLVLAVAVVASGLIGMAPLTATAAATWSNPVNITHTPDGWTGTPANSVNPNGVPFAAFEDRKNGDAGQVMENDKAAGDWQYNPYPVTTMSTGDRDADIATNKNGYTVTGWQSYYKGGGKANVFVGVRGPDGQWTNWIPVSKAYGNAKASSVSLTDGPDGNFYAVWMQSSSGNDADFQVYFSKSTNNGYNWTEPVIISGPNKGTKWPKIAVANGNKMLVAWMQSPQIFAASNVGSGWVQLNNISEATLVAHNPALAADADGNIHVVWDAAGLDGFDLDVYYKKWIASSNSFQGKNKLTDGERTQARNAVVAVNGTNGEIYVVYMDDRGRSQSYFQLWFIRGTADAGGTFHGTQIAPIFNSGALDKDVSIVAGNALHMVYRSNVQDPKIDIMSSKLDLIPPLHAEITQPTSQWSNQPTWTLNWEGTSPHGDPHYKIRVTTSNDGGATLIQPWTILQDDTTATSMTFDPEAFDGGAAGTYYFQAKAIDTSNSQVEEKDPNAFDKKVSLDMDAPTGSFVINGGAKATTDAQVTLTVNYADATSGVATIKVSNSGEPGVFQSIGPGGASPKTIPWSIKAIYGGNTNNDEMKTVTVKINDKAVNVSDVMTKTIFLDRTPPTGTIKINGDAAVTNSRAVTLTLTADDGASPYPVKRFKLGNMVNGVPQWITAWQAFEADGSMTIPDHMLVAGPDGNRKVVVRYEDEAGYRTGQITDNITLDTAPNLVAPEPVSGVTVSDLTPLLDWTNVPGATKYMVTIHNKLTGALVLTQPVKDGSSLQIIAGQLKWGKNYQWSVQSYVEGLWSGPSGLGYFSTPSAP